MRCSIGISVLIFALLGEQVFANPSVSVDTQVAGSYLQPAISIPYSASDDGEKTRKFWESILSIHLVYEGEVAEIAVLCNYEITEDRLVMRPRQELSPASSFVVTWRPDNSENTITLGFQTPEFIPTAVPLPKLLAIYPLGPEIPENTLLFYAVFDHDIILTSQSMQYIDIAETNDMVKEEVAWSSYLMPHATEEKSYIPILVHPGRVKSGVNEVHGYSKLLYAGKSYVLTINNEGFLDPYYRPLAENYQKEYIVTEPDSENPKFLAERSELPHAGTRQALILFFSEPMDYISMVKETQIIDAEGERIAFQATHYVDDASWQYIPLEPWQADEYTVEFTQTVRDRAHNTFFNTFEVGSGYIKTDESLFWSFTPRFGP